MTQINVCIANKQMHDKHKDQLTLPKQGDQISKRTEETHTERANMKRIVVSTTELYRIRTTSGPPP